VENAKKKERKKKGAKFEIDCSKITYVDADWRAVPTRNALSKKERLRTN